MFPLSPWKWSVSGHVSNTHMTPEELLWLAGSWRSHGLSLPFFSRHPLLRCPAPLGESFPVWPLGGGASLFLPVTSRWHCCIILVMSSCNMQQQRRIMGLFFFLLFFFKAPPNVSLSVPSWPVARAILLILFPDATTWQRASLSLYWSAAPKRGLPMRWQETV